jgi:hypothetical protein
MQQIRGNLNGFDCDVSALPLNRFFYSMLIRFTSQALVSDIKSNAAFAGVTRLNLVILGLPCFSPRT